MSRTAASDESMRYNGQYESIMFVSDRDIQVPLEECINGICNDCSNRLVSSSSEPCTRPTLIYYYKE